MTVTETDARTTYFSLMARYIELGTQLQGLTPLRPDDAARMDQAEGLLAEMAGLQAEMDTIAKRVQGRRPN